MSDFVKGNLKVKLPNSWTGSATVVGRVREKKESEERERERETEKRVSRKKIKVHEEVAKSRIAMFFRCFMALEG